MFGQGCPHLGAHAFRRNENPRAGYARWIRRASIIALWGAAVLPQATTHGAETTTRLRIAWGGGAPTSWEGAFSISNGQVSDPTPLGVEIDAPGSMWLEGNRLRVDRRGTRPYDGVDVTIHADASATFGVSLSSANGEKPVTAEFTVARLRAGPERVNLDSAGNYLLIQRSPGDSIRVTTDDEPLVFAPGELLEFTFEVDLAPSPQDPFELHIDVAPANGEEPLWSHVYEIETESDASRRQEVKIPVPDVDGVYTVGLTARPRKGFVPRWVPGAERDVLARREIQFVVFDASHIRPPTTDDWTTVDEIDASSPTWWRTIPKWMRVHAIPGLSKGALGNAPQQVRDSPNGKFLELPPHPRQAEPFWWAAPIPVNAPDIPHLLEIELDGAANGALDVGVSIFEPNAAGKVVPIGRDFGLHGRRNAWGDDAETTRTYRMVFWPRTDAPVLLVSNLARKAPVGVGRIKISAKPDGLPQGNRAAMAATRGRLAAGVFSRPLLPEAFGTRDARDPQTGQTFDDWRSFHDAASRLTEFLQFTGRNAAVVSVFSDGASIYPSSRTSATLLYDAGMLSSQAQDPIRKDCLELLFRSFDRGSLALIPSLEFNAPLPAIEALRRGSDPQVVGLEWIGADGRRFTPRPGDARTIAPRYNLLNPKVQDAVIEVVREIATRYDGHPAFAGVAIELSQDAFTQLPGVEWGFDDDTVARFESTTGLKASSVQSPETGPSRFRARARRLLVDQSEAWRMWRAAEVTAFFERLQAAVAAGDSGRSLYLVSGRALDGPASRRALRPTLSPQKALDDAFLDAGLDWSALGRLPGVVVSRPYYQTPPLGPLENGFALRVNHAAEIDRHFADTARVGVQLVNRERRFRLPSFSAKSPFGPSSTYAALATQTHPNQHAERRLLIRALADHDAEIILDGGQLLPTSFNPSLNRILRIHQQLPSPTSLAATKSKQPLIARTYESPSGTVVCVLNDSPWPIDATVQLRAPAGCTMLDLDGDAPPKTVSSGADAMNWDITLAPYDLTAARFSANDVRVLDLALSASDDHALRLRKEIDELAERAAAMGRRRRYAALKNPNFETKGESEETPGWRLASGAEPGVTFARDGDAPHGGAFAGRLASEGAAATLVSEPFATPATGRLTLHVRLRTEVDDPSTPVHIIVEDNDGPTGFRPVIGGTASVPLKPTWEWYAFPIDDLPVNRDADLRLRFDLMGKGRIWIDDVELYDLDLVKQSNRDENVELFKIIYKARTMLEDHRFSSCDRILDSYWPTFLRSHVPLGTQPEMQTVEAPAPPAKENGVAGRLKDFVPKYFRK